MPNDVLQQDLFVQGFRSGANTDVVASFTIQITTEDGSPADISEATASSFKAKKAYGAPDTIIALTEEDGIEFDANTSLIVLNMTVGHLSNVNLSRETQDFVYDWDWTIDSRRHRLMFGTLTVRGDV